MGIDNLGLRRGRGDDNRSIRGPGGIRGPPPMTKFRRGPGPRYTKPSVNTIFFDRLFYVWEGFARLLD